MQNADRNLQQILAWLNAHPSINANTDVFVTSDHGFATISHKDLDAGGGEGKIFLAAAVHEDDLEHRALEVETIHWDAERGMIAGNQRASGGKGFIQGRTLQSACDRF